MIRRLDSGSVVVACLVVHHDAPPVEEVTATLTVQCSVIDASRCPVVGITRRVVPSKFEGADSIPSPEPVWRIRVVGLADPSSANAYS